MKIKVLFFVFILAVIFLTSGLITELSAQEKNLDSTQLILRFTAKYTGSIGWGDVYKCPVTDIIKGNLQDSVIVLYISVNSFDSIFKMKEFYTGKRKTIPEHYLKGSFKQVKNDKPYVNFQNAFIDKKNRTWVLFDLKSEK